VECIRCGEREGIAGCVHLNAQPKIKRTGRTDFIDMPIADPRFIFSE
jgi:hypothetical protein